MYFFFSFLCSITLGSFGFVLIFFSSATLDPVKSAGFLFCVPVCVPVCADLFYAKKNVHLSATLSTSSSLSVF